MNTTDTEPGGGPVHTASGGARLVRLVTGA